jgi:hypothetical protein
MKFKIPVIAIIMILAFGAFSHADVIIKKKTKMEGLFGMGGSESSETEYIKSDKSCTKTETKFTGGIMKMAGKGKKSEDMHVTRLDKGVIWNIFPDKKKYTEMTFDSLKVFMNMFKDGMGDAQLENDEYKESDYEWKVEIKGPDNAGDVNGFKCQSIIGKAMGTNKKDPKDKINIAYSYWLSNNIPNFEEMDQYYKNYAKALGLDDYRTQQDMSKFASKYAGQLNELFEKVKQAGGYPIKMSILIEKTADEEDEAESEEAAKEETGDEEAESDAESAKQAAEMMKKIGGMLGQKEQKKSAEGMITVIDMTYEVTAIESKSVDDAKFEIPAGFEKE